jgi:hypothetical protein
LVYSHTFFKVSQWLIVKCLNKIDGLILSISKQLNSRMIVSAHVHRANDTLVFGNLQLFAFDDNWLVAIQRSVHS